MSLTQLWAIGRQNQDYNIPRNLAIEYFTEDFDQNNELIMSRDCDTKIPEHLEIELSPHINIDNFK